MALFLTETDQYFAQPELMAWLRSERIIPMPPRYPAIPRKEASKPESLDRLRLEALRELAVWINHWSDDAQCGLLPTETSLSHAKAVAARAIKGTA